MSMLTAKYAAMLVLQTTANVVSRTGLHNWQY